MTKKVASYFNMKKKKLKRSSKHHKIGKDRLLLFYLPNLSVFYVISVQEAEYQLSTEVLVNLSGFSSMFSLYSLLIHQASKAANVD